MSSSINHSFSRNNAPINRFVSKLRRLKIQEGILFENVNKCCYLNSNQGGEINKNNDIEFKKYVCKLTDEFRALKNLFEDIKVKTNDQKYSEKTDIDELKKDIFELETKIRTLKHFTANEFQRLRNEEIKLTKEEIPEISVEEGKVYKYNVGDLKEFKEIVPSPVRVMIHSPFRCAEVQQFQDFMKNSPNRYGGWNEYNHNIFVKIWNKHFGNNNITIAIKSVEDTFTYQDFKEEVLKKTSGICLDSIVSHIKWYSDYLHHKLKQQEALNKWKENKMKIKPTRKKHEMLTENLALDESLVNTEIHMSKKHHETDFKGRNSKYDQKNRKIMDPTFTQKEEDCLLFHQFLRNEKVTSNSLNKKKEDITKVLSSEGARNPSKRIDISRLMRPTKQWIIKRDSIKESRQINTSVDDIVKLRIPSWRLNLN